MQPDQDTLYRASGAAIDARAEVLKARDNADKEGRGERPWASYLAIDWPTEREAAELEARENGHGVANAKAVARHCGEHQ